MERSALSVLIQDRAGLLGRIGSELAQVGANITSIVVARTEDPEACRMTVMTEGAASPAELAEKLGSIDGVMRAAALRPGESLERELAIFRVLAETDARARVVEIASVFRARLIDATAECLTLETVGIPEEIDALQELLEDFGIVEMVRTGPVCHAAKSGEQRCYDARQLARAGAFPLLYDRAVLRNPERATTGQFSTRASRRGPGVV